MLTRLIFREGHPLSNGLHGATHTPLVLLLESILMDARYLRYEEAYPMWIQDDIDFPGILNNCIMEGFP